MTNSCVFQVHASLSLPLFYKTCCKSGKAAVANLCALIQCAFLCHIYLWMFCCRYSTSNSWIAEPRQNILRNLKLGIPQNLHVKHRLLNMKNTDIWTCISIMPTRQNYCLTIIKHRMSSVLNCLCFIFDKVE